MMDSSDLKTSLRSRFILYLVPRIGNVYIIAAFQRNLNSA